MSENRIRVNLQPELTPTRLEDKVDKMDVNAEIDVGVNTHVKGLGMAGIACIVAGALAVLVASVMLAFGYPTPWIGAPDDGGHTAFVKGVVLTAASGVVLLFFGTSAFFYGRTVLGSGQLDEFTSSNVEVTKRGA